MSTEEFTGHVAAMRADSEFYGAEDFVGRGDVAAQVVKCNRCLGRKACGVNQKEMFTLTLHIDGKLADKELWLKPTNRKQLVRMYGPNVADWKSKWIWLFVEEVRSPQGGMTLGIRIRDKKDAPKNAAQPTAGTKSDAPKPEPKAEQKPTGMTIVEKYAKRLAELKPEEIKPAYLKFDAIAPTMAEAEAQAIYAEFAKYAQSQSEEIPF